MKYALLNPPWSFEGSIYVGCREPHLPLEYGYAKSLLTQAGHEVLLVDGHLDDLSNGEIALRVAAFQPDFTVVTTAPSYLFWRCAPPELHVPQALVGGLASRHGILVAIGPHGSTTPGATLRKLGVDVVVLGEAEEILPRLAGRTRPEWREVPSLCYMHEGQLRLQDGLHASDMAALPALEWPCEVILRHHHHHHRFDIPPCGPGAEVETSRGCTYHCSFCAKENFCNHYRKRPLPIILAEIDGLIAQSVEYIYLIDEIFLPNADLLEALAAQEVKFGIRTRIDLWSLAMLDLLGHAGCVSVEAGVESIAPEGRALLDKQCKLSTDELAERLIYAKKSIPFVQANFLNANVDLVWPVHVAGEKRHLSGRQAHYGHIRQLGHLSSSMLASWLVRAAIYALPARNEPFGLSVLVAGFAGCVLIPGDIPSLRENWDGAALLIAPDDSEALRITLNSLSEDRLRLTDLAALARAQALQYSPQRMLTGYLATYRELLRTTETGKEAAMAVNQQRFAGQTSLLNG